jgi:hypothetical protein
VVSRIRPELLHDFEICHLKKFSKRPRNVVNQEVTDAKLAGDQFRRSAATEFGGRRGTLSRGLVGGCGHRFRLQVRKKPVKSQPKDYQNQETTN